MVGESATANRQAATPDAKILRIRVSLKGRPLRTFSLSKAMIIVGRDPEADIHLDNPGVSRHHLRIEKAPEGFYAQDLCSANGTFLNDEPIQRKRLQDNDVLRVGKFTLWISYEEDRRGSVTAESVANPIADPGTTVLSSDELRKMMSEGTQYNRNPTEEGKKNKDRLLGLPRTVVTTVIYAFAIGVALGAGLIALVVRSM